ATILRDEIDRVMPATYRAHAGVVGTIAGDRASQIIDRCVLGCAPLKPDDPSAGSLCLAIRVVPLVLEPGERHEIPPAPARRRRRGHASRGRGDRGRPPVERYRARCEKLLIEGPAARQ